MSEVLGTEIVTRDPETFTLRLATGARNERLILLGDAVIASEGDDQVAFIARLLMDLPPTVGTVAWIGGGFCVGPRLLAGRAQLQTVYELREVLRRFCPPATDFIPGDWRTTLRATYDIIIYDLGDEPPYDILAPHLLPGGFVLPRRP